MDRRTQARELVLQALCQLDVQGEKIMPRLPKFFAEYSDDGVVLELASSWTRGIWKNIEKCDELITACAQRWDISRLSMVDRNILRLGTYQLSQFTDIPPKVVINEAIELAKKYSTEASPAFTTLPATITRSDPGSTRNVSITTPRRVSDNTG